MLKDLIGKEVEICVKFVSCGLDRGASPENFFGTIKDVDEKFCTLELMAGKRYSINKFTKVDGGTLYININDIAMVYVK